MVKIWQPYFYYDYFFIYFFVNFVIFIQGRLPHLFKMTHLVSSLSCEKSEVRGSVFTSPVFIPQGICLRRTKLGAAL